MKLKNKLIPLTSVLATASVVAPLAISMTSCSPWMRIYDVTDGPFAPDIYQADIDRWDQFEATQNYIDECKARPRTFIQDVMYGQSTFAHQQIDYYFQRFFSSTDYKINKFEIGVSKPSFGMTTTWGFGEADWHYPTVSFDQVINLELQTNVIEGDVWSITNIIKLNINVSYRDVIFYTVCDTTKPKGNWKIGMFDDATWYSDTHLDDSMLPYITNINPWSVNYNVDVEQTEIEEYLPLRTQYITRSKANKHDNVTDALSLQTFRNLWFPTDSRKENISWSNVVFALSSRLIVFNFQSYYLEQITPSIDIRQQRPLTVDMNKSGWTPDQQYIDGIIIANAIGNNFQIKQIGLYSDVEGEDGNISFVQDPEFLGDEEEPTALRTISTNVGTGTGADEIIVYKDPTFEESYNILHIRIPVVLEGDPYTDYPVVDKRQVDYVPFYTSAKALRFQVQYSIDGQEFDPVTLICYLNYNSLTLNILPQLPR